MVELTPLALSVITSVAFLLGVLSKTFYRELKTILAFWPLAVVLLALAVFPEETASLIGIVLSMFALYFWFEKNTALTSEEASTAVWACFLVLTVTIMFSKTESIELMPAISCLLVLYGCMGYWVFNLRKELALRASKKGPRNGLLPRNRAQTLWDKIAPHKGVMCLYSALSLRLKQRKQAHELVRKCEVQEAQLLDTFFFKYCPSLEQEKDKVNYPNITWGTMKPVLLECSGNLKKSGYFEFSVSLRTTALCGDAFKPEVHVGSLLSRPSLRALERKHKKDDAKSVKHANAMKELVLVLVDNFHHFEPIDLVSDEFSGNYYERFLNRATHRSEWLSRLQCAVENMDILSSSAPET